MELIYFVTTFSVKKSIMELVDTNSAEYQKENDLFWEKYKKAEKEFNQHLLSLNQKYPELCKYLQEVYDQEDGIAGGLYENDEFPENIPVPSKEEYSGTVKFPEYDYSKCPKIQQEYYKVENSRTPVFFSTLEAAKDFVNTNSCDWEEAGYYTMALIQGLFPDKVYQEVTKDNCFFYTCDEGWIETKLDLFQYSTTLFYNGLPVIGPCFIDIG